MKRKHVIPIVVDGYTPIVCSFYNFAHEYERVVKMKESYANPFNVDKQYGNVGVQHVLEGAET